MIKYEHKGDVEKVYLENFLEQYNDKKVKMFVDMDGVIADFNFGKACDYDKKRPLYSS